MTTISYLGPAGTFTHQALLTQRDVVDAAELIEASTITETIAMVRRGDADYAFVPIENAIEGTVNLTLDELIFGSQLYIQREVELPIHLQLAALSGTDLAAIKTVLSFPVATAQCTRFLASDLPHAMIELANSTADAVRLAAERNDPSVAAIGPALAVEHFGLSIVAPDIEDFDNNATRFLLLSAKGIATPTGHDRTTIVCFQSDDRPGNLQNLLSQFSSRGINLTKLESRTTKMGLGSYCFVIDCEGHVADEIVGDALLSLRAAAADVKVLGSYPIAGVGAQDAQADRARLWSAAHTWLDTLRSQIGKTG